MSKIQWEYELVEKPFCEQLQRIGWQWIEGDPDLPETTERESSRQVLLKNRLAAALKKLNLRNGQPWLDDARVARAIRDLEQAAGHRIMDINQSATELLLKRIGQCEDVRISAGMAVALARWEPKVAMKPLAEQMKRLREKEDWYRYAAVAECRCELGDPTALVIGSGGAQKKNSYTWSLAQSAASSFK